MTVAAYYGKLTALWEELHTHEPLISCSCCPQCTAGQDHEIRRGKDMLHECNGCNLCSLCSSIKLQFTFSVAIGVMIYRVLSFLILLMCAIQDQMRKVIGTGSKQDGLYYFRKSRAQFRQSQLMEKLLLWHFGIIEWGILPRR